MIRNKNLVDVIRPLLNEMPLLDDEAYGRIMKKYSPACRCSATVKMLDYFELCKLSNNHCYNITIIQNGKIFEMELNNYFYGRYEHISACYQINPFNEAIVVAENNCKYNSYKIFCYEPYAFDRSITLPDISCLKYLFVYFNVYKQDGSLAQNFDELKEETEVVAISKQSLTYTCHTRNYPIRIILRWYNGYF